MNATVKQMLLIGGLIAAGCASMPVTLAAQNPFTLLSVVAATKNVTLTTTSADDDGRMSLAGFSGVAVQLSGTWTGTVTFEVSIDGTTYTALNMTPPNSTAAVTTATANGQWMGSAVGFRYFRARFSTPSSGSPVVGIRETLGGGSGSGGGGGGSVTINDPNTTSQKAAVNASGQLSITCANCSGSGASFVDKAAFTAGTDSGAPAMGLFETSPSTVTTGHSSVLAMTNDRHLFVNIGKVGAATITLGSKTGANSFPVVIASDQTLPLPSGASTAVADGGTFTASTTTANPIAGFYEFSPTTCTTGKACAIGLTTNREAKVSLTTALPAGTNGIGKLTANGGVIIGDVNINGVSPNSGRVPVLADINNGSTTVTEAATLTAGQSSVALTNSVLFGYDGSTDSRVAAKSSTPASNAVGLVVRPLGWTDGTNTAPTMDAAVRAGYMVPTASASGGGASNYSALQTSGAVFTAQIKGAAGQVYEIDCTSTDAAAMFVRLYDQTGAPASTDGANIVWRGTIPGAATGAGFVKTFTIGRVFATGVGIRISGAVADNDTTVLSANKVMCNVGYK
jgi:hypothetical protein